MEYLGNLVANYSFTVPFALKKLGEQRLSLNEIKEMEDFIKLQKFYLEYHDITDQWESIRAESDLMIAFQSDSVPIVSPDHLIIKIDGKRVMIFFIDEGMQQRFTHNGFVYFPLIPVIFKQSLKQFMIDHKNDIYKVFLCDREHFGKWLSTSDILEIRTRMMVQNPKN